MFLAPFGVPERVQKVRTFSGHSPKGVRVQNGGVKCAHFCAPKVSFFCPKCQFYRNSHFFPVPKMTKTRVLRPENDILGGGPEGVQLSFKCHE